MNIDQSDSITKIDALATAVSSAPTTVSSGRRISVGLGGSYYKGELAAGAGVAYSMRDMLHLSAAGGYVDGKEAGRLGVILEF
ncbi:YadA-like family protein [Candidatus Mycalebacterium sp.]